MSAAIERQTAYRDFTLKIERAGRGYIVHAQGPTGSEGRAAFSLPFSGPEVENFILKMNHPRRSFGRSGRAPEPAQPTVEFGGKLYDALCCGEVRDVMIAARREAELRGYGLRVKLRLSGAPELADLPWEFLYDGRGFLALSTQTPLVRYLDVSKPYRPLKLDFPLRMLATISSPGDLPLLDVQAEQGKVQEALGALLKDGLIALDWQIDGTLDAFRRTLRQARRAGQPYHVWHHIGHGVYGAQGSELMFCDLSGRSLPVGGFQLGALFNDYPELRLALLNACEGARPDRQDPLNGVAAALVECGVPAVIGMQFEISDRAAIQFAEEFYTALVGGQPVDAAVSEARLAVFCLPNWVEWATPVLFMRAADGILFEVARRAGFQPAAAQEESERRAGLQPAAAAQEESARRADFLPAGKGKLETIVRQPFEPEMVLIPAGPFLMGSDPAKDELARVDEQPQHTLTLPAYWMAKTPITNAQYLAFVQASKCEPPGHWENGRIPPGKEQHPVVYVSWHDAVAYCQWLAQATGRPYRLPTEAEWEKGARGTDGRTWPWGNQWDQTRCNSFEGKKGDTTPVGAYPAGASPYGLLDMAGNVWEWTGSLYVSYPYRADDGREDISAETYRVLRGGAFSCRDRLVRCAVRCGYNPDFEFGDGGFRVVASPV